MQGLQNTVKPHLQRLLGHQPNFGKKIRTTGSAVVERNPDQMTFNLQLTKKDADVTTVIKELAENATQLVREIKAFPFPLIQRATVNVGPNHKFNPESRQNEPDGFIGSVDIQLEDKSKDPKDFSAHAATIVNVAHQTKATLNGPFYSLTPDTFKAAQEEAAGGAFKHALSVAKRIATAGNFTIQEIPIDVIEGGAGSREDVGMMLAGAAPMTRGASLGGGAKTSGIGDLGAFAEVLSYNPIPVGSKPLTAVFKIEKNTTSPAQS